MIRSIVFSAVLLGLTACASSGPAADTQAATTAQQGAAANSDSSADTSGGGESLDVVEVPAVAKTATAPKGTKRDELVCWRERSLGSHRSEKICRFRSEIDAERDKAQHSMRKAQTGGPTINNE